MDKLLKEAIADAKAVRETALANAKIALEEAFTPHLKSMLSKKIQSEMDHEDEEKADEGYHGEEDDEEKNEELKSSGVGSSDNKEPGEAGDTSGIGQDNAEGEGADAAAGEEDENLEKAPDQAVGEGYGMDDEGMDDEDDMEEGEGMDDEGMHDEDDMEEGMHDEEDEDLEEILRQLESEMNEEEEEEEPKKEGMHDEEDEENMDEEVDLDEIIKALTTEEEVNEEEEDEKKEEAMVPAAELEEYKQTVTYLKDKLSEVNLLNAKLLYTNKLFRSRNVSEEQKMKVVEQFDRAANVREVKLVYTTFAESMKRKPVNESARRKSVSSKPVASTEPKKPIIGENTDFKSRMKKLANII